MHLSMDFGPTLILSACSLWFQDADAGLLRFVFRAMVGARRFDGGVRVVSAMVLQGEVVTLAAFSRSRWTRVGSLILEEMPRN